MTATAGRAPWWLWTVTAGGAPVAPRDGGDCAVAIQLLTLLMCLCRQLFHPPTPLTPSILLMSPPMVSLTLLLLLLYPLIVLLLHLLFFLLTSTFHTLYSSLPSYSSTSSPSSSSSALLLPASHLFVHNDVMISEGVIQSVTSKYSHWLMGLSVLGPVSG